MEPLICQSCGMSCSPENMGTRYDLSKSKEYCRSCYQAGKFVDPSLTLQDMEIQLLEKAEVHDEITLEEAQQIIRKLKDLKRWQMDMI